ncbi:MAG: hypothetical protein Q9P90_10755 [candidate division KSB1 bacterium]|nr:hypothetical protein [candidate division KSB1 bacterium]
MYKWLAGLTVLLIFMSVGEHRGYSQTARQDTLRELMRRIEILTEEIEKSKLQEVADRPYKSYRGLGPAASQVYFVEKSGVSLAGYGEVVYESFANSYEDGTPANKSDKIDFLRNIIYLGYKFNDRIYFNSEIEIEHGIAGGGGPGEVAMEFGYVDFEISPHFIARAGMILVPMGIVNEWHEPPTFYTALRPETERAILPTTWRANGFGALGNITDDLTYRIYLLEGFDARKFSAAGVRKGRQSGAQAKAENFSLTGRLDYSGLSGFIVGGSFYYGKSGQGLTNALGEALDAPVSILSFHAIYRHRGIEARALYARTQIGDVADLNQVLNLNGQASIGEQQYGYYLLLAYNVLPHFMANSSAIFSPFVQYERVNTQAKVPSGYTINSANDRTHLVWGIQYKPISNVSFKIDYMKRTTAARSGLSQLNVSVSYMF